MDRTAVQPLPEPAPVGRGAFDELLGLRSSKGRYYSEYRHSAHDLERTLLAVNAVSWVLADTATDARTLVDSTLPVLAELLDADAVVLVSASQGRRSCLRPAGGTPAVLDADPAAGGQGGAASRRLAEALVETAARLAPECPETGLLRNLPELGCTLLLAPLPRESRGTGYVVAAVPRSVRADATDLALLGTLANQLAGAVESSRRLTESEQLRVAAGTALRDADAQAVALARRNALLRQARVELVSARESQVLAEERQRIARDLHDSLAQHVLSIGMQIEWCRTESDQPELVERLTAVKELARSTVDRIRQAIFELSGADEVQPVGLVPALRRLAAEHRGSGLAVFVRATGPQGGLPAAVERALYMAVKEALFNTLLHAEASRARVHVTRTEREVRVQVTDDGSGRAEVLRASLERARHAGDGSHRGLPNLEHRVRQVGGTLRVHDAPGGGVRLGVAVPLDGACRDGGRR